MIITIYTHASIPAVHVLTVCACAVSITNIQRLAKYKNRKIVEYLIHKNILNTILINNSYRTGCMSFRHEIQ